jgi:hypothetical protein
MNIIPVGDNNNLFKVTDVFPQEIIKFCKTADWNSYEWEEQLKQEQFPRKLLKIQSCLELQYLKNISIEIAKEIQEKLNLKFQYPDRNIISVWRDTYEYKSPIHRDFDPQEVDQKGYFNIPVSMQVYLSESNNDLGTKFYYDYEKTQPKYFFPFEINTGYLQINDYDQWHEMIDDIGKDENRISCHMIFSQYTKNS